MARRSHIVLVTAIAQMGVIFGLIGATAWLLLGTTMGRTWVEERVEAELRSRYRGGEGATLAGLSLLPIGTISLDSIVLRDSTGAALVSTGRVSVRVNLQPLFDRELHVIHVVLDGFHTELAQDSAQMWNVERVMQFDLGDDTAAPSSSRPWRITVDSVAITNASASITRPDSTGAPATQLIGGLNLHLGATRYDPGTGRGSVALQQFTVTSSAPPIAVRAAAGRVEVDGRTLALDLTTVALDRTRATVRGTVGLPASGGDPTMDLAVAVQQFDVAELQWVSDLMPSEGTGRAAVRVRSGSRAGWTRYDVSSLDFHSGASRVLGSLVADVGPEPNDVEARQVDVRLEPLDFALLRDLLGDSVPPPPFEGALRGRVRATGGPLQRFVLDSATLEFDDRRGAADGRVSRMMVSGTMDLAATDAVLHALWVRVDSMPIQTVGAMVDIADSLRGSLFGRVRLDGPITDLQFSSLQLTHRDGDLPESRVYGLGRLVEHGNETWVDAELDIEQLSVAAFGHPFASTPLAGTVSGTIATSITGDSVWLELALQGEGAAINYVGATSTDTARLVVNGALRVEDLDARRFLPKAELPAHRVTATAILGIDGPWEDPTGPVTAYLDPASTIGDIVIGEARTAFQLEPGGIRVDTLQVAGPLGRLDARGRLSRDPSLRDSLRFLAQIDSIAPWRHLLPDSTARAWEDSLGGRVRLEGVALGSFDTLDVRALLTADSLRANGTLVHRLRADLYLDGLPRNTHGLATFESDSLVVGGMPIAHLAGEATVREPTWYDASLRLTAGDTLRASVRTDIRLMGDSLMMRVDSVEATTDHAQWSLEQPASLFNGPTRLVVDSLRLRSTDGARFALDALVLAGGDLDVRAKAARIPLAHGRFTGLMPPRVDGTVSFDVALVGTTDAPSFTFSGAIDTTLVDGQPAPSASVTGRYADRVAAFTLRTAFAGNDAAELSGELPVDLSFTDQAPADRLLNNPLYLRFSAFSAPLSGLAPFIGSVRDLNGGFDADIQVTGTWKQLEPRGYVFVREGQFTVPALSTGFEALDSDIALAPDSIVVHSLRLNGDGAASDSANFSGAVVKAADGRWRADLRTMANRLRVIDDPRVAEADVSWTLWLRGALDSLRLSGDVSMPVGNIFIGRQQRQALRLEEEEAADLDPMKYAPTIESLRIRLGNEVRLRSPEASVQLTGSVDVTGSLLDPDVRGEILATRGTYRIDLGLLQRTFQVDSGRVRMNGPMSTPATLDVHTSYTVRQAEKDDVKILARLAGTVDEPRLTLSSGDLGTTANDTEIISYLLFGAPSFALDGQSSSAVRMATAALVPSLGGAAERALGARIPFISELQVTTVAGDSPRDFSLNSFEGLLNSFALTAGTQVGTDSYLRVSGGVCRGENRAAQSLPAWMGVTAEYRPRERLSAELSLTPGSSPCNRVGRWTQIYQFGLDLFRDWRW